MRRTYHVHVIRLGARPGLPVYSEDTYHAAHTLALAAFENAQPGTLVEITHASVVLWHRVKGATSTTEVK